MPKKISVPSVSQTYTSGLAKFLYKYLLNKVGERNFIKLTVVLTAHTFGMRLNSLVCSLKR